MTEDLIERGYRERLLIDISEPTDVKYWTEQFGVTAAALKTAVKAVGPEASAVEAYLKRSKV
jgi:Protein of unknown function (DUF3606)